MQVPAALLFNLGALALLTEIIHPSFFAGIFGIISLVFAYFALGSLETNWAGAALVVLVCSPCAPAPKLIASYPRAGKLVNPHA